MFVVVSVPTNGSNVAFNWSSGFHFCLIRFSSQRSTFDACFLNDKYVKRVKKGFLDTAVDY